MSYIRKGINLMPVKGKYDSQASGIVYYLFLEVAT